MLTEDRPHRQRRVKNPSDLTTQGRRRLSAIHDLGRALFEAHDDIDRIFHALASSLTESLCDGCAILHLPSTITNAGVTRHRIDPDDEALTAIASVADPGVHAFETSEQARTTLPRAYEAYIDRFGLRGLAILPLSRRKLLDGTVTVTRDRGSPPFEDDDLIAIETCIEYASLAAERALQLEADRSALRAERERTSQFQHEMLGILGHDLRSPLGAIMIGTEMLAMERKDAAHVVTRIVSFATRMTRIVDQLLDLTRARLGGGIPLARCRTRLSPLIRSVMEDLAQVHPGNRLELVCAADVTGLWDSDRLYQVASTLVGNAVQYGLEGGAIHVAVSESGGAAKITVHNELRGHPIPPEALAVVFEPYRRGSDPEYIGAGLGLGLYIVHEIVHAHRGTITVESSPSGTTFHVVLPDATVG